jgi:putative membrane protein
MNQFQAAWTKETEGFEKGHGAQSGQPSVGDDHAEASPQRKAQQDDATVKVARAITENVFNRELPEQEKEFAGQLVHYLFGVACGGFYGAAAEFAPQVTTAAGLPFGAVFWILADETVVPVLGLSKGPSEYRLPTHLYALSAHLVYGVSAELTRRAVRATL